MSWRQGQQYGCTPRAAVVLQAGLCLSGDVRSPSYLNREYPPNTGAGRYRFILAALVQADRGSGKLLCQMIFRSSDFKLLAVYSTVLFSYLANGVSSKLLCWNYPACEKILELHSNVPALRQIQGDTGVFRPASCHPNNYQWTKKRWISWKVTFVIYRCQSAPSGREWIFWKQLIIFAHSPHPHPLHRMQHSPTEDLKRSERLFLLKVKKELHHELIRD